MKRLLIVYHTPHRGYSANGTGGCDWRPRETEVVVRLETAVVAGADELLEADGYLFACPENLAAMSGLMKDFFDRSYYPVLDRLQGRPYATLICAGSDGSNAARQVERIATGWRLKAIALPLIVCTAGADP